MDCAHCELTSNTGIGGKDLVQSHGQCNDKDVGQDGVFCSLVVSDINASRNDVAALKLEVRQLTKQVVSGSSPSLSSRLLFPLCSYKEFGELWG